MPPNVRFFAGFTRSRMQSATRNSLAAHTTLRFAFNDAGRRNRRSARAMQDGVYLALLHFLQQLTDFQCGRRNDLDPAPFRLR
jgi:hypothetical protein